jgi:glycosyltransferase involved in cell wall biosynthesis
MPDFSVVIPTRQRVPFLLRALASVARQRYRGEVEVVVVDDGAGEGAAAARASGLTRLIVVETGGAGQVPARNRGIAAAGGRRIAFLDDDDWWADEDHLARLDDAWAGPALHYTSGLIVRETEAMVGLSAIPFAAKVDAASIRHDNTLLVSAIAFDRALHDAAGGFDESLPYYWDWDFYLRLFADGAAFWRIDHDGVRISARDSTVSSGPNAAARQRDLDRLCAKHGLGPVPLKNHETIALAQQAAPTIP